MQRRAPVLPITQQGSLIIGGPGATPIELVSGTDGHVLTLVSGAPAWAAGGGGGGGSVAVEEADAVVVASATVIDFDGTAFNISAAGTEANVALNLGTGAGQPAAGDHAHAGVYANASHNHAAADILIQAGEESTNDSYKVLVAPAVAGQAAQFTGLILHGLTDVDMPFGALEGDFFRHDGTAWTAETIQAGDLPTHNHTQAQSHDSPDTDSATTALHHTLGAGANQAAAGNHNHAGVYAPAAHNHAAGDINSGVIATARLGSGTADATTFLRGDQTWQTVAGGSAPVVQEEDVTVVAALVTLDFDGSDFNITDEGSGEARIALNYGAGAGQPAEGNHTHAGADITSGTVATARLGSGTANATTFLRGDGAWAEVNPLVASYTVEDDFIAGGTTTGNIGLMDWTLVTSATATYKAAEANHPGVMTIASSATSGAVCALAARATNGSSFLPADFFDMTWIVRPLETSGINHTYRIGAFLNVNATPPADGVFIERAGTADGTWFAVTRAGGSQTRTALGTYTQNAWCKFRIRRISGTQIGFTQDGGTEVVHTATIPTAVLQPAMQIIPPGNAARSIDVDYFGLKMTGLTR